MFELGELDALPVDFDEKLWNGAIDHVTVYADERVVFVFKDKAEITTTLWRRKNDLGLHPKNGKPRPMLIRKDYFTACL